MKIILKAIIFSLFLNASGFAEVNFQQKKFYYENLVKNWSKYFQTKIGMLLDQDFLNI